MTLKKSRHESGINLQPTTEILVDNGDIQVSIDTKELQVKLDDSDQVVVTKAQAQTLTNKTIDADNNTISNLEVDNLKAGVLNTSTSLSGASDSQIPSALAVKSYADSVTSTKVSGPAISTDNAIARYDGTTGKLLQNSSVSVSDAGVVSADDYIFTDSNLSGISTKEIMADNLGSGVESGGIISIGTPNTTISISDGNGYITSNIGASTSIIPVSWTGLTNQTLTYLNTHPATYLAINSSGTLVQQTTPFTNSQSRDYIVIGAAIHTNLTIVNNVNQLQHVVLSPSNQLQDLQKSLGFFNVSGNIYSPNGANLNINKSAGVIHKTGCNWDIDQKNPNVRSLASGTAITFRYRLQNSTELSDTTTINPDIYDVAGVSTPVPSNRYTIQRINVFSSNGTRIQLGQHLYNNLGEAISAIQTEVFVTETNIAENGLLRGFLVVRGGTTDLSDTTRAFFLDAPKFGGTGGVGGLSTTTLQGAYNNSSTPQITTSTALGSVDIKRGSTSDSDAVFRALNGAGTATFQVKGDGTVTGATIDSGSNTISNITNSNISPSAAIDASKIANGSVSNTEFQYLDGVTSAIQTQINAKQNTLVNSAGLAAALSDETGNGLVVFNNQATITNASIQTPSRLDAKQDTLANLTTYALTATNGQFVFSTDTKETFVVKDGQLSSVAGSASSGINYILNPTADTNINGWVTYADAAGTNPVDGTGGSPASTYTRNTTTPLRNTADFLWTKSAANRQGEGFSYDFTIDRADRNKVLQISFDYQIASGTYADNDMTIWIYDVTNATLIQPAPSQLKNVIGSERMGLEFQTSSSLSYRFIVHTSSTSALAYSIQFDNFIVGPQAKLYGSPVTDEVPATYTLTNAGNATVTGTISRIGKKGVFKGRITIGSSLPTGTITLNLPTGISLNTFNTFANSSVTATSATTNYVASAFKLSATSVTFYGPSTTSPWNATVPATWVNGNVIDFTVIEEVTGWGSSTLMSNDANTRVVAMRASTAVPVATITSTPSLLRFGAAAINDTHGAFNPTTGLYTCPVSGFYKVNVSCAITATFGVAQTAGVGVARNGSLVNISYIVGAGTTITYYPNFSGQIFCNAGDTLAPFVGSNASGPVVANSAATNYFTVDLISGPAQIAASETVSASYWLSANFAASTTIPINFDSREWDSHNAVTVSPTAWRFTAPMSGTYSLKTLTQLSTGSANYFIYKNGSAYKYLANNQPSQVAVGANSIKLLAGEYIDIRPNASLTILGGSLNSSASSNISIERTGNY